MGTYLFNIFCLGHRSAETFLMTTDKALSTNRQVKPSQGTTQVKLAHPLEYFSRVDVKSGSFRPQGKPVSKNGFRWFRWRCHQPWCKWKQQWKLFQGWFYSKHFALLIVLSMSLNWSLIPSVIKNHAVVLFLAKIEKS